ncbi:MAG TPA: ABC transporter permease [bacterium]|nr:ABC transporter permease [bacterium]
MSVHDVPRGAAAPAASGRRSRGTALVRLATRHPVGALGAAVVATLVLVAAFAGYLSPVDPNAQVGARLSPPSVDHLLGLDQLGRDVLSRLIFGARVSLLVSATSVGLSLLVGGGLGLIAGYHGGAADQGIMRAMDLMFTVPSFVLAIALTGILGPSLPNVIVAIAIVTTPTIARVARAPALTVRETEFVSNARAAGAGDLRILWRHVLPNVAGPIIVQVTACIADAILIEAGLSFLGLGVQPPYASWGNMLGTGRSYIGLATGLSVFPGAAIMLAVLGFNFAGDGLRDMLDPRWRRT